MNRKPYYRTVVESTCVRCHNEQRIGAASNAAELALEILDRLNISKGYLGWTALYYKEKNWPENTKQELDEFWSNYHKVIADGHRFDLLRSDEESIELLTQLKEAFRKAWKEKQTDMRR